MQTLYPSSLVAGSVVVSSVATGDVAVCRLEHGPRSQSSPSPVPPSLPRSSSASPCNATSNYFPVTVARAFLHIQHHPRLRRTRRPPTPLPSTSISSSPPSDSGPVSTPPFSPLMVTCGIGFIWIEIFIQPFISIVKMYNTWIKI